MNDIDSADHVFVGGPAGEVAGLLRLLGDPTRLRVLHLLQHGEMNVTALCGKLDLAQPTVSHHLGLLRTAGLVRTRRAGKQIYYSLHPDIFDTGTPGQLGIEAGPVRMNITTDPHARREVAEPRPFPRALVGADPPKRLSAFG